MPDLLSAGVGADSGLPDVFAGLRQPPGRGRYASLIHGAELRYGIPSGMLDALIGRESNYNPAARSKSGAVGLGQLRPEIAQELGVDPSDPAQNIDGSARHLGRLLRQFKNPARALAAYKVGAEAIQPYKGVPPFPELQAHVNSILRDAPGAREISKHEQLLQQSAHPRIELKTARDRAWAASHPAPKVVNVTGQKPPASSQLNEYGEPGGPTSRPKTAKSGAIGGAAQGANNVGYSASADMMRRAIASEYPDFPVAPKMGPPASASDAQKQAFTLKEYAYAAHYAAQRPDRKNQIIQALNARLSSWSPSSQSDPNVYKAVALGAKAPPQAPQDQSAMGQLLQQVPASQRNVGGALSLAATHPWETAAANLHDQAQPAAELQQKYLPHGAAQLVLPPKVLNDLRDGKYGMGSQILYHTIQNLDSSQMPAFVAGITASGGVGQAVKQFQSIPAMLRDNDPRAQSAIAQIAGMIYAAGMGSMAHEGGSELFKDTGPRLLEGDHHPIRGGVNASESTNADEVPGDDGQDLLQDDSEDPALESANADEVSGNAGQDLLGGNGEDPALEPEKNPTDFIPHPTHGGIDYGVLDPGVAAATQGRFPSAPIRLQQGHSGEFGYGLEHLGPIRVKQMQKAGFPTAQDFFAEVLGNYDRVIEQTNGRLLLIRDLTKRHAAVIELQEHPDGRFYTVKTALIDVTKKYGLNNGGVQVWSRASQGASALAAQGLATPGSGPAAQASGTQSPGATQGADATGFEPMRMPIRNGKVIIRGDELGDHPSFEELRKAARAYGKRLLQFKDHYVNADSKDVIFLSQGGLDHLASFHSDETKASLVAALPDLIEQAKYLGEEIDKKGRSLDFFKYEVPVELNGKDYIIEFKARQAYKQPRRLYHLQYEKVFGSAGTMAPLVLVGIEVTRVASSAGNTGKVRKTPISAR